MAIDSPKNDFVEKHRWLTYADDPDTVYDGSKIMDGSVTTDKLADYAVTTDKIDDESITFVKLGADVLNKWENIFVINPDTYFGSDTDKLQAAVNDCTNGGTIILTRMYELESDIDFKTNTNNAEICIIGIGNHAGISFDAYCFKSTLASSSRAYSGVRFINCELCNAAVKCVDGDTMIRCAFDSCFIHDNASVAIATDYLQDYTFSQCKCTYNTNIITAYKLFGGGFSQCTIEAGTTAVVCTNNASGFSINNCIIEGITGTPIQLMQCLGVSVDSCYFENVGAYHSGAVVDLSTMTTGSISINNNFFHHDDGDTVYSDVLALLPVGVNKNISLINNRGNDHCYLFDFPGTASANGAANLTYYGNSGFIAITPNTADEKLPLSNGVQGGCTMYTDTVVTFYVAMNNSGTYGSIPFDKHGATITLTEVALEGVGTRTLGNYTTYNQNSMISYLQCTDATEQSTIAGKVLRVKLKFSF